MMLREAIREAIRQELPKLLREELRNHLPTELCYLLRFDVEMQDKMMNVIEDMIPKPSNVDSDLLPFEFDESTELIDVRDEVKDCGDPLFILLAGELCSESDPVDLAMALQRLSSIYRQLETVTTAVRDKYLRWIYQEEDRIKKRRKKKGKK